MSGAHGAENAAALYEQMSKDELLQLKAAFEADETAARSATSIAFAAGRLALIARELKRRRYIVNPAAAGLDGPR